MKNYPVCNELMIRFMSLIPANSTKQKERVKPREKVPETQQDNVNKQEKENNYLADEIIKAGEDATTVEKHNLHVNIEAASNFMQKTNMNDRYSTEPSPKINKNNFMKQSLLSYQKLLPDGYSLNKKFGNRRNMNHHANSLRDKKDTSMDRFVLNDDLPEYCKYEVTHADIEKHRGRTLGVPGAVKDKVSMWLNSQEQTSKVNEESNSMKSDPVDYKENVVGKEPEEYSGVIGPEARDVVDEEKSIHQESLHVYSDSSNSQVIEESAAITTDSKSNSVLSQIDSEHNDVMNVSNEDNNQIKEMTEEINELDLNTSSTNMCQNSFDVTTENTSFYISDEESNLLLDNMKSTAIAQNHRVEIGDSSSFSSSACLSESDFVTKYQTSNNKKKGQKPKSSGASMESDSVWRLDGPTVIQVDGLNRNCVLSHLEDMVSGFGMVSDCEQKTYRDKLSVRFK